MKKITVTLMVIILILLAYNKSALSWNDDITHRLVVEYATELSTISKNNINYLHTLGFINGIEDNVYLGNSSKKIRNWLADGGELEDDRGISISRSKNHFHNPLKPWQEAGLSDLLIRGKSALLWAQDGDAQKATSEGDWSWKHVRDLYYDALTSSDSIKRSAYFAQVFKGIGHQMHLLQDMAVPYHARNDAHPLDAILHTNSNGSFFESWVKQQLPSLDKVKPFAPKPIFPAVAFNVSNEGFVPITQFYDTKQYKGNNPDITIQKDPATAQILPFQNIGLSEYTNANFFSDGTINLPNMWLSDGHEFPYPNASNTNLASYLSSGATPTIITAEDGISDVGFWIQKMGTNGEIDIVHFAKPGYFTNNTIGKTYDMKPVIARTFILDDACHHDYAEKLLPRAVGYSAALINYFFRGQLGVSFAPGGIRVNNLSKDEMTYYRDPVTGNDIGSIEVYYDDTENIRHPLGSYDLATMAVKVLAPGQETPVISFDTPGDNIKKNRYIIVFKGKFGSEEGAVVGRVYVPAVYYFSRVDNVDKIARVEMDGSNRTIVVDAMLSNLFLGRFSLSPDGNAIVFMNLQAPGDPNGNILHLDLMTGKLTWLATGNNPDWSPDGTKIVFSRDLHRVGNIVDEQIFTRDIASSVETQLTDVAYSGHYDPVWSPDGTRIAYAWTNSKTSDCMNDITINVMTVSGAMDTPVTCATGTVYVDREPAWSPDGNAIAFVRGIEQKTSSQLHKVTLTAMSSVVSQLTISNVVNHSPAWSPDGSAIAIATSPTPAGNYDVHLVNAQTGEFIANLTEVNPGSDALPVFGK